MYGMCEWDGCMERTFILPSAVFSESTSASKATWLILLVLLARFTLALANRRPSYMSKALSFTWSSEDVDV